MIRALIIIIALLTAMATPAYAADDLSVGCLDEITQEPGLIQATGECITPAEYDALFSYNALDQVLTLNPFDGDTTVAAQYNIAATIPPSYRLLGAGLVDVPFTFRSVVARIHQPI